MLTYLVIIVIAFGVVNISITRVVEKYLINERVSEQQKVVDNYAVEIAPHLDSSDAEYMLNFAVENGQKLGGRFLVLNSEGVVQIDGFSKFNGMKLDYPEVDDVVSGTKDRSYGFHQIETKSKTKEWVVYYASAVIYNDQGSSTGSSHRIGVLLFSVPIQDVEDKANEMSKKMNIYLIIVSLIICAISFVVSGFITKPVKKITDVIKNMSNGRLDQRIEVTGNNELSELGTAFNIMSEKLEHLDKSRNDFVANASHELKTPLSSMKILAESLLQQKGCDESMYQEFLTDIDMEIDRLTSIINDLLTLVHLDKPEITLNEQEFELGLIAAETVKSLIPIAKQKKVELELVVQEKLIIKGDKLKLQQVISNLADNGIKYTNEGGYVKLRLFRNGRFAVLEVSDNGIGIPEEDIVHVFDRFYRVDKARSRATGGTGLGLSIVQNIVKLHNGTINVKSKEGSGSVFTVELPLNNM